MPAFTDRARASDGGAVRVLTKAEAITQAREAGAFVLEGRARVEKYEVVDGVVAAEPYEVLDSEPNLFLTEGVTNLWELATGQGGTTWADGNARLAVGSDLTPATVGETTLRAETGRVLVDPTGGVVISGNAVTYTGTFGTGAANSVWGEVGVTTAGTGGIFLNRLVQNFGEKTSSAQWILQLTLSIS